MTPITTTLASETCEHLALGEANSRRLTDDLETFQLLLRRIATEANGIAESVAGGLSTNGWNAVLNLAPDSALTNRTLDNLVLDLHALATAVVTRANAARCAAYEVK